MARAAASVRVLAPSLRMPARMWVSTVSREMPSCPAMRRVGSPCGDQAQHVAFAVGEVARRRGGRGCRGGPRGGAGRAGPGRAVRPGRPARPVVRRPAGAVRRARRRCPARRGRAGSGPPRGGPDRARRRRPRRTLRPPVPAQAVRVCWHRGHRPGARRRGSRGRRRRSGPACGDSAQAGRPAVGRRAGGSRRPVPAGRPARPLPGRPSPAARRRWPVAPACPSRARAEASSPPSASVRLAAAIAYPRATRRQGAVGQVAGRGAVPRRRRRRAARCTTVGGRNRVCQLYAMSAAQARAALPAASAASVSRPSAASVSTSSQALHRAASASPAAPASAAARASAYPSRGARAALRRRPRPAGRGAAGGSPWRRYPARSSAAPAGSVASAASSRTRSRAPSVRRVGGCPAPAHGGSGVRGRADLQQRLPPQHAPRRRRRRVGAGQRGPGRRQLRGRPRPGRPGGGQPGGPVRGRPPGSSQAKSAARRVRRCSVPSAAAVTAAA